ncbi:MULTISPECIES: aconitate hydratase AcnA [unclassified Bradyrhizobium]|uniref:aconitate hydratase AcnA n=1 Tax=unclassified Bradyrhizobium TaxID=2631580 RepID=UPI00291607F9|nr:MULTISPECIES: aconitate hydratase AcnA [unclassified Bradyrhizobium]
MSSTGRSIDSFRCRRTLTVDGRSYEYFSLAAAEANGLRGVSQLPVSLKVLLENLLRHEDGETVTADDILAVGACYARDHSIREIAFRPARVLMQDYTGAPAMVDLAAMRDAAEALGADPQRINPVLPVDLVIDHSLIADRAGSRDAFAFNTAMEFERNSERYRFLRWAQSAFRNFRVVPPGTGICHQINLEYLAQPVWIEAATRVIHPDTLVGTDSHTTMVNAIGVLGWGVGGIDAEAAMLGQSISMLLPEVIGVRMSGRLREGVTSTDLVLTITELLRRRGVVNRFVEFFGPWLDDSTVEDRATIANMAPEYGATCGFFPVDAQTLEFWRGTGRNDHQVRVADAYYRAQGMFRDRGAEPIFNDVVELDLASVQPSLAGPKRPHDRIALPDLPHNFGRMLQEEYGVAPETRTRRVSVARGGFDLGHGDVVIAAITSCTNTSNPGVMVAAGLLARKAVERGLRAKPWVKTSLAPGSTVVMDYLAKNGLDEALAELGFHLVGYGCTTCTGNSGPLPELISTTIHAHDLAAVAVISGNRNFEGRVHPDAKASYLASPPLVVAYALAGTIQLNLSRDPIGRDAHGAPVYLREIWPSTQEIAEIVHSAISRELFLRRYHDVFDGNRRWQSIEIKPTATYAWQPNSTYIRKPPYFTGMIDGHSARPISAQSVVDARILGLFLDSITTDHISPVGSIDESSPAGRNLLDHQIAPCDFNSYGARRGNHEVMTRGAFANTRTKNQMVPGVEGGVTVHHPSGERMPIYEAAMRYQDEQVPLVILAGKEYGSGSSRDWAAKGTKLLGVRAVIAESFERIHRANLVGMGVLPLVLKPGLSWRSLGITGAETITIPGLPDDLKPRAELALHVRYPGAGVREITAVCGIETVHELNYFRHGGVLPYTLAQLISREPARAAACEQGDYAEARP